jgi:hypothetical protein
MDFAAPKPRELSSEKRVNRVLATKASPNSTGRMMGAFSPVHSTAKQAFDRDVFIYIRQMDSLAARYQAHFSA